MRTIRIIAAFLFVALVLLCASCTSTPTLRCATPKVLAEHQRGMRDWNRTVLDAATKTDSLFQLRVRQRAEYVSTRAAAIARACLADSITGCR